MKKAARKTLPYSQLIKGTESECANSIRKAIQDYNQWLIQDVAHALRKAVVKTQLVFFYT